MNNLGIINSLNTVAYAAAQAGDMNTVSGLQQAICFIQKLPGTYDSLAYNASPTIILNPTISPYNNELFDAEAVVAKVTGLTPMQLGN